MHCYLFIYIYPLWNSVAIAIIQNLENFCITVNGDFKAV